MCNYWIVNRNNTTNLPDANHFLWAPETRSDGTSYKFYSNIKRINSGDIICSLSNSKIEYIGSALGKAYKATKPTGFQDNWPEYGYKLDVEFEKISVPILLKDIELAIKNDFEHGERSLFTKTQKSYKVTQGSYIAPIGPFLAEYIENLYSNLEAPFSNYSTIVNNPRETEKLSSIRARINHNIFKKRLCEIEKSCRITKTSNSKFLIASHIKPWRASTNEERLDGYNGLLLAPHIDKLFDNGYISFRDNGQLIVSSELSPQILLEWNIKEDLNVGEFESQQKSYLDYHRKNIFKGQYAETRAQTKRTASRCDQLKKILPGEKGDVR